MLSIVLDDLNSRVIILPVRFLAKHTATETKDDVEGGLLLNVVVGEGVVLELFASEDQALLLLVLDVCLDVIDGVRQQRVLRWSTR